MFQSVLRPLAFLSSFSLGAAISGEANAQLLHRYSFDGTGSVALDSAGADNGTLIQGATLTGSGSVALDGIDGHVSFPAGILGPQEDVTLELWFRWDDTSLPPWSRILDFGESDAGAGNSGTGLTYVVLSPSAAGTGLPTAVIKGNPNGSSERAAGLGPVTVGTETHIAMIVDTVSSELSLYVDGVLTELAPTTYSLLDVNDETNWLGRSLFNNTAYFQGEISELRIYGNALSAVDMAASFAAGPDASIGSLGTNYCGPAVPNSTGVASIVSGVGSTIAADNNVTLACTGLPNGSFGYFLTSMTQGNVPMPNMSLGTLCLGGSIGRYVGVGQIMNSGSTGQITLTIDLTQHPQPAGLVSVAAGETWNFQMWHRDVVAGNLESNFSNGLQILFN